MPSLFSQAEIDHIPVKNRIVMPPMVCFGWTDDSGMVSQQHIRHYEARAKGGTGLVILEATCINKNGRLANTQLGIWSDEHIPGLSAITKACHRYGAKVLVQIHHAGLKTPASVAPAVAPSQQQNDRGESARELTKDEIRSIQEDFVQAAKRAEQAGFDGIELHGAHGFLIDQFMSPITNRRTDEYGGDLLHRARFALEIVEGIKGEVSDSFILGYRMGGNEPTLKEGIEIAKLLQKAGVEVLHVSAGISDGTHPPVPKGFAYNWIVYQGTQIKCHVDVPVIVVNGIRTPQQAAYLVENDLADFVAVGRGHLVDPQWARKAREGLNVISCLECQRCQWFVDGQRCPRFDKNV